MVFESEVPDELFLLGDAVNQTRQFPAHLPRLDVFEALDFHGFFAFGSLFVVLGSSFFVLGFFCNHYGGGREGGGKL